VLDQKYRLEEKIGSGGFGAVFRATHLGLGRPVAVKVFRPMPGNDSPEALKRFRLEGASASRVNHPNAVAVLDCGISEVGIAYLVMELLDGHSLRDEMEQQGVLPPARVIEIALPVCRVLAEVHSRGIVHRDIKPDNIFLHRSEGGEVVKVVDFGLAKIFGDEANAAAAHTMTGGIIGTPAYIAPERVNGDSYDGRTDVYSLGVIMFQMLTGRPPFETSEGGLMALMVMHVMKEPPRLRDLNPLVPVDVEDLVLEMLNKDPGTRPDARRLAEQLAAMQPRPQA
jgi:serine/threonine protein kinase